MQQFMQDLKEFKKGLRVDEYQSLNSGLLIKAFGYRVSSFGLTPISDIDNPISPSVLYDMGLSQTLPHINVINSKVYCLIFNFSTMYIVNRTTGAITETTNFFPYSLSYPELTVIDFDNTIYLHNGKFFYKYDGTTIVPCGEELDRLECNTSCMVYGRVFIGGIVPDERIKDYAKVTTFLNKKTMWWSKVGGYDFTSELTETTGDAELAMLSQETGFMAYQGIGDVVKALPFKNTLIVYGTTGVYELRMILEPIITMSTHHLSRLGLRSGTDICAGRLGHLFVTSWNELYFLTYDDFGNITLKKIGCKEYIDDMGTTIKISYNEEQNEFYVSSNLYTLVVTDKGVTQLDYVIHGVVEMLGRTIPLATKTNKIGDAI